MRYRVTTRYKGHVLGMKVFSSLKNAEEYAKGKSDYCKNWISEIQAVGR